jgi:2-keto-3-deoxy-6-phosphogluconate aldolase
MYNSRHLIEAAKQHQMPILCGVLTLEDALHALRLDADALKFFPATNLSPNTLQGILNELRGEGLIKSDDSNNPRIYVAGGVQKSEFGPYLSSGATGFAIGLDCRKVTPSQMRVQLKELRNAYSTANKSITSR